MMGCRTGKKDGNLYVRYQFSKLTDQTGIYLWSFHHFVVAYPLNVNCEIVLKVHVMCLALAKNWVLRLADRPDSLDEGFVVNLKRAFRTLRLSNTIFMVLGLMATTASQALSQDVRVGDLIIDNARIRATPSKAPVAGGYLTIMNVGSQMDRLIGISAPFAVKTEIHAIKIEDNIMRMRRIEGGIEIPPDGSVILKPGGRHIMFTQLKEQLTHGEQRTITLVFERHGNINIQVSVQDIGKEPEVSLEKENSIDHSRH